MKKAKKIILVTVLILALLGGLGGGGYAIWRSHNTDIIEVYPVSNLMTEYWGDTSTVSGQITSGKVQEIHMREGLIDHIAVEEGQSVKKGDVLLVYDTTSFELTLQADEARIGVMENNIKKANDDIARYRSLAPAEWAPQPTEETIDHGPLSFNSVIDVGTPSQPEASYDMLFRCQRGARVTKEFLQWLRSSGLTAEFQLYEEDTMYGSFIVDGTLLPEPEEKEIDVPDEDESKDDSKPDDSSDSSTPDSSSESESSSESSSEPESSESESSEPEPSSEPESDPSEEDTGIEQPGSSVGAGPRFVQNKKEKVMVEPIDEDWDLMEGLEFTGDGISVDFSVLKHAYGQLVTCTPMMYERYEVIYHDNMPANPGENYMYTKKELAEMILERQKQIVSMQLDLRELNLQYEKDKLISKTGEVTAEIDGVVSAIGDPAKLVVNDVLLSVKGAESYSMTAFVSESSLKDVQPGETFSVFAYESGMSFTATVSEIETTPVEGYYAWGPGNPNSSFYPVHASVDDPDVQLTIGEYCEVTLPQSNEGGGGLFLPRYMIRKDDSGSYVMKRDENERLKKQYVRTGRMLWGDYYEIMAGLSVEDEIAFPYGKTVREGAETKHADYPSY